PPSPTAARAITITQVKADDFVATFSNRGAELVSFRLLKYYTKPKGGEPVELVKARDPSRTDFPFAIEGRDAGLTVKLNTALYEVRNDVTKGSGDLEYRYVSPEGVAVAKTFHFSDEYLFTFAVSVSPPMPYRLAIGPGIRTL